MKKLFGSDSRLAIIMGTAWNLIVLNLLTLLTCIPVVTVGASLTSMHYVLLKLVRNEEGYISKMYFRAFKENFKSATVIWLIEGIMLLSFWLDWRLFPSKKAHYIILIATFIVLMLFQFAFPLLSHFENTITATIRNSLILCIAKFPRTLVMTAVWIVPYLILTRSMMLFPLILMLGISLPGYIGARFYHPVFKQLEPPEENSEDTEILS